MTVQESCRDADDDVFEAETGWALASDGSINMPTKTSYSCPVAQLTSCFSNQVILGHTVGTGRGTNLLFWPQIICLKHVWKLCQIYGRWWWGGQRLLGRRQMSRLMGHATACNSVQQHATQLPTSATFTSLIKCVTQQLMDPSLKCISFRLTTERTEWEEKSHSSRPDWDIVFATLD